MLIAGLVELDRNEIISMGISKAVSLMEEGMDLVYAVEHAEELLRDRVKEIMQDIIKKS